MSLLQKLPIVVTKKFYYQKVKAEIDCKKILSKFKIIVDVAEFWLILPCYG